MDADFVLELFIKAAEIEDKLPSVGTKPATPKSIDLGYQAPEEDVFARGPDAYKQRIQDFWDSVGDKLTPSDVSDWEACNELIKAVTRERDRRCLWAYARSKAELTKKKPFIQWCKKVENIHRNYAKACAIRAIDEILCNLIRNGVLHKEMAPQGTLQDEADFEHKAITLGKVAPKPNHWMAEDIRPAHFDDELQTFSWVEARRERERQRYRQRTQGRLQSIS